MQFTNRVNCTSFARLRLGVVFAVRRLNVCQTEVVRWHNAKVKVNVDLYSTLSWTHLQCAQLWHTFSRDLTVLPAHPAFTRLRNEPYLHLPSQSKLVLIYRPRRDERLSWQTDGQVRNLVKAALTGALRSAPYFKFLHVDETVTAAIFKSSRFFVAAARPGRTPDPLSHLRTPRAPRIPVSSLSCSAVPVINYRCSAADSSLTDNAMRTFFSE